MKVLFPAPFGPSSPMAPGATCRLTPSRARCGPKTFVSPRVSMTGAPDIVKCHLGHPLSVRQTKSEMVATPTRLAFYSDSGRRVFSAASISFQEGAVQKWMTPFQLRAAIMFPSAENFRPEKNEPWPGSVASSSCE